MFYLLGNVVIDSGIRWSRRRLRQQLAGRTISAHVADSCTFRSCGIVGLVVRETFSIPLWCGACDSDAISPGHVDTHRSVLLNPATRDPTRSGLIP
jgi:hypothetical protein